MNSATLPLQDFTVIDFTRLLPGPWCGQYLADLGATVIKVESPGRGDNSRYNPPHFSNSSVYFNSVNGGKQGISLDLANADGKAIAHRLISQADIVLEAFKPGTADKLGIGYAKAQALNPSVIYCSISGYGQTGDKATLAGHDLAIQSLTGLVSLPARTNEAPPMPGFQAADYAGATTATMGILSAVIRRQTTGEGGYIDVSMFDSLLSMCNVVLTGAKAKAVSAENSGMMQLWGGNPRYSIYQTRDGKAVAMALLEASLWKTFCETIGRTDLINTAETSDDRHTDHGEFSAIYRQTLSDYCLSQDREPLIKQMTDAGIPVSPVYSPEEALHSDLVQARNMVHTIDHPLEGQIPVLSNPLAISGLAGEQRSGAPGIGEHNQQILEDFGYSPDEIAQLGNSGALG